MKIWITVLLVFSLILSCTEKNHEESSSTLLQQFENELKENINKMNKAGDSINTDIVLDTLYLNKLALKNYRLAFAQYHTKDDKLNLAILGIENFAGPNAPTFLLVDKRNRKYHIASVKINNDSLFVHC